MSRVREILIRFYVDQFPEASRPQEAGRVLSRIAEELSENVCRPLIRDGGSLIGNVMLLDEQGKVIPPRTAG